MAHGKGRPGFTTDTCEVEADGCVSEGTVSIAALPAGSTSLPADAPIVTRFSSSNSNLDKPFRLIVESAGWVPWPKLFQNLRAS